MRDIAITLVVVFGCLYTLKKPYIGVLLWSWLSYMNPHRMAYGFAYTMPFAYITAIVLSLSILFTKERKSIPLTPIIIVWVMFILYMGLTTYFAFYFELAWARYIQVLKIQLVVFFSIMLMTDMKKIDHLLWVIVISIGYFSVKGGVFTLITGGSHKVWGPPESLIEGNNELAIASLMIIPLMAYLHQITYQKWIKNALILAIGFTFVGALGSQSRGALIAFVVVAFNFWLKSEKKLILAVFFALMIPALFAFMPQSWYDRMNTIKTYDEDASAMGRINAWEYAFNAANNRLFGMGFDSWSGETFALYAPNPNDPHAAHSIYFSVLGDHGWIGLLLYLSIIYMSLRLLNKIINNINNPSQIIFLSKMLKVSLTAFLVGGAFLSLSYFDLSWSIYGIIICVDRLSEVNNFNRNRQLKNTQFQNLS